MQSNIQTITPAIARHYLQRNQNNRVVTQRHVEFLADAMMSDNWNLNGEAIKVDVKGNLLDGQHRLEACLKAGVSFKTLVVEGLDTESFVTMDTGRKRTSGDLLSIEGVKNYNMVSAIIRSYIECRKGNFLHSSSRGGVASFRVLDEYNTRPLFYDKVATDYKKLQRIVLTTFMGITLAAIDKYGDDFYEPMIEQLSTGVGLSKGSPILALREFVFSGREVPRSTRQAFYVKTIRAAARGEDLRRLVYSKTEKPPRV